MALYKNKTWGSVVFFLGMDLEGLKLILQLNKRKRSETDAELVTLRKATQWSEPHLLEFQRLLELFKNDGVTMGWIQNKCTFDSVRPSTSTDDDLSLANPDFEEEEEDEFAPPAKKMQHPGPYLFQCLYVLLQKQVERLEKELISSKRQCLEQSGGNFIERLQDELRTQKYEFQLYKDQKSREFNVLADAHQQRMRKAREEAFQAMTEAYLQVCKNLTNALADEGLAQEGVERVIHAITDPLDNMRLAIPSHLI